MCVCMYTHLLLCDFRVKNPLKIGGHIVTVPA